MKLSIPAGTTSKRIAIFVQDSSSTTGAGLTGLAFNSAGLTCYSWIDTDGNAGGTAQALQTATLGTWTTRGFIQKDSTNLPGYYEFGIPDALLAAGVKWANVMFKGATNMAPLVLEIEVTAVSNQDSVRGGLTALPNAAAEAAGGLYTRGSGAGQINQPANGLIDVNVKNINNVAAATPGAAGGVLIAGSNAGTTTFGALTVTGTFTISDGIVVTRSSGNSAGLSITGSGTGNAITLQAGTTGIGMLINGGGTSGEALFLATSNGDGIRIAPIGASKHGIRVTGGSSGTSDGINVTAGSGGVAIRADITGNITGNLSGSVGSVTGAVGSVTGAVGSVTGNVGGNVVGTVASVVGNLGGNIVGNLQGTLTATERVAMADAFLDRDMSLGTDSGSTTVRTPRQALRFLRNKWSIAAGTLTVTKENDATTSWSGAVATTAGNPVSSIDPA